MAKILIVDDSRTSRRMLRNILVENGHEVIGEAENGQIGFEKYIELKPDIVTLDITMPVLDGLGALKKIIAYDENGRASLTHPKWKRCINDLMYFKVIKRKHWTDEAILVQYSNGDFQWLDCGSGEELEENRELASLRKLAENDIKHNRIGKHL